MKHSLWTFIIGILTALLFIHMYNVNKDAAIIFALSLLIIWVANIYGYICNIYDEISRKDR